MIFSPHFQAQFDVNVWGVVRMLQGGKYFLINFFTKIIYAFKMMYHSNLI